MASNSEHWALPGGYVDIWETPEEAARREAREEAQIEISSLELIGVFTDPKKGIVVVVYTARTTSDGRAGDETEEVRWFSPKEIPWNQLGSEATSGALRTWLLRSRV